VPRSELSTVPIQDPETAFQEGQVVRCRVVFCKPEEKALRLSFIVSEVVCNMALFKSFFGCSCVCAWEVLLTPDSSMFVCT
jgi:hypothetical protein